MSADAEDTEHGVSFLAIDPLVPGSMGLVTSQYVEARPLCVTHARAIVGFRISWIGRLLRRLPLVKGWFRVRDEDRYELLSAQLRIDHVAIGNFQSYPDKLDELPLARSGSEISVKVTNTGDTPVVVNVLVEGRFV